MPLSALARLNVSELQPVAKVQAYRGRVGYSGMWWMRTLRSSVEFPTLRARDSLIVEDFSNTIEQIVARPLQVVDPTGHVLLQPEYLIERRDGTIDLLVLDVDTHGLEDVGALLRDEAGMRVVASPPLPDVPRTCLHWLAGFRMTRFDPDPRTEASLVNLFARPAALGSALRRSTLSEPRTVLLDHVYNLLWRCILAMDLSAGPLSMRTVVWAR